MGLNISNSERIEGICADSRSQIPKSVRTALLPLLLSTACGSPKDAVEAPGVPEVPISEANPDVQSSSSSAFEEKQIPAENQAILEGQPFEVTIPAGDNPEKAFSDFRQFCKQHKVQCAFDKRDHNYQQLCDKDSSFCSPEYKKEGGDLRKIERAAFMCRPDESYQMTLVYKNGRIEVQKVPQYLDPELKKSGVGFIDFSRCPELPPLPSSITLNELLRTIMEHPWLLNTLKKNKLPATGSIAKAWLPVSEVPSNQKVGDLIPGHPNWVMLEQKVCQTDCRTGEKQCENVTGPVAFRKVEVGYNRVSWDRNVSVVILWDGKQYRITYEPYCL